MLEEFTPQNKQQPKKESAGNVEGKKKLKKEDYVRAMDEILEEKTTPFTVKEITRRLGLPVGSSHVSSMFHQHADEMQVYREKLQHAGVLKREAREKLAEAKGKEQAGKQLREKFLELTELVESLYLANEPQKVTFEQLAGARQLEQEQDAEPEKADISENSTRNLYHMMRSSAPELAERIANKLSQP